MITDEQIKQATLVLLDCEKEDYDKAHPTARRIIKVVSYDV